MKRLLVLLALLVAATVFSGCNSSGQSDGGGSTEGTAPSEGTAGGGSSIEFWGWNDDEQLIMRVKDAYEAEYPGRIVNVTIVPVREYTDKVTAALAANTEIDALCINGNADFAELVSRNQLLNLDDMVAADGLDMSIYGENYYQVMYEDSIYSLPYRSSVWVVAYNKTLFEERGVELPTDDITWDGIFSLAQQMTFGEGTEKTYGLHYHNRNDDYLQIAYQNGFTLLSDDFTYVRIGMEKKLEAIELGITMPHAEILATGVGVRQTFEQKTNAMYFTADWTINQMRNSLEEGVIDFEFDFIAMPHLEGKPAGQTHGSWIHTSVVANSKKHQDAFEFVKYIGGIPGATIFAAGGTLPAAKYNDEVQAAFIGDRSQDPANIDVLFSQTVSDPAPLTKGLKEIDDMFKEEAELVFIGEKTINEAIESIQKRRADILA